MPRPVPHGSVSHRTAYFTELTFSKAFLYSTALIYVTCITIISFLQPFFFDLCKHDTNYIDLGFENPGYDTRLCQRTRTVYLCFLTPEEVSFGRRIVFATLFGGLIGFERRSADRPAGIRTMSLVSLGACLFSICSAFAFIDGPMNWDGSRVSAAIPSGVGFLGAGIIWKQVKEDHHTVHGLTTAASLWLSAAVGIACAGELYFAASFSVAVMMILLRFGPRLLDDDLDSTDAGSQQSFTDLEVGGMVTSMSMGVGSPVHGHGQGHGHGGTGGGKYGSTNMNGMDGELPNQLLDHTSEVYSPLKDHGQRGTKRSRITSRKSKASIRD